MRVVVSQSMYFPWVGLLEQVRLADIFVHLDDVTFTKGFYNRVQVKTAQGPRWLTIPLQGHSRDERIADARIDNSTAWRVRHRDVLRQAYRGAPFVDDMLVLVDGVFAQPAEVLAQVSRASILTLADYFGLATGTHFLDAESLGIGGASSQRLLDIVLAVGGTEYITGHGARNYLDHELFERHGVAVRYMRYRCLPYQQAHGEFTPYVTALDLVAQCGRAGANYIVSEAIDWRTFVNEC